jgi:glycosyltransferase involved in cell wall biosynthesis
MSLTPIIQLVDGFATEEKSGGAAQFGIQLALYLDRRRFAPYVCGLWGYDTPSERRWRDKLHAEGIGTTILIEEPQRLAPDMLRAAARLQLVVDRVQPRIINSHFERGDLLGMFSKVLHPRTLRIVRTMHADQQWQTRPWLGALMNLVAFPWLFDAEVAISQDTKRHMDSRLAARLRARQAPVLYNAISGELVRQLHAAKSAQVSRSHAPRIAIIGRLEEQKGHRYFLAAAAEILPMFPGAEFWIIGTGSLREELEAYAHTLGLGHSVRFWGQRSDVAELLLKIDLLVSASIWEGFPTIILEAMAAQVPVVATDVSGSRELVRNGETGMLVPMRRPDLLAHAIQHLLDHSEEAQRMARNAQAHARAYTMEATAEGYGRLYEKRGNREEGTEKREQGRK